MKRCALTCRTLLLLALVGCSGSRNELVALKHAAESGDVVSQYNLGCVYVEGDGVPKDPLEAAKWFLLAAESGDVDAQYMLASLYDQGEGVKEDDVEAVRWYLCLLYTSDAADE